MMLCKLILFRINLEVHFNMIILKSEPLSLCFIFFLSQSYFLSFSFSKTIVFLNLFQALLAQDSRIA